MSWTLAATAAGAAIGALVYAALAATLWRKEADPASRVATRAFAAYWAFTSAYDALSFLQHALAALDIVSFELALAVRVIGLGLAAMGIAGLLSFFVYLQTGRRRAIPLVYAAYALTTLVAWYHVWVSGPTGVALTAWSVDLAYVNDFNRGGLFLPLTVMLLLAPIVGAVWFMTLARRAQDARQRYRILAVGGGVSIQLLSFLIARTVPSPEWELVSRIVVGLLVATLVVTAYATPLAIPRRVPTSQNGIR